MLTRREGARCAEGYRGPMLFDILTEGVTGVGVEGSVPY